MQLIIKR